MANNQYVNKVIFGNDTILDISEDTVVSSALLYGYTAHAGSGASISGSILTKTSSDLTASGLTVTVPSGYYGTVATKTLTDNNLIAANIKDGVTIFGVTGTLIGNTMLISDTIDVNGGTIRTITITEDPIYLETLNATSNGTYTPTSGHYYSSVSVEVEGGGVAAILQEKTNITPTESSQIIEPDNGYNGLSSVQINAISSTYVGSGITSRSSSDLTVSGATVNVPAGYYAAAASKSVTSGTITNNTSGGTSTGTINRGNQIKIGAGYYATDTYYTAESNSGTKAITESGTTSVDGYANVSVTAGTEGTPTATKGTVSSHSISITPSVTNVEGYITGGTHNGTAVTVSASELVSGNKAITGNGTNIDVTNYATVSVTVEPSLQAKTSITPTESSQTIEADDGYYGLSSVQIDAISSTYVGSGIISRSSSDLSVLNEIVNVPAGYYSSSVAKAVTTMTLPTSTAASATSGYTSKATINRSTSDQYINIAPGYNSAGGYYKISAVANGSATGPSSLSGSSATLSTGTNTITLTKTGVTTTPTVSAGYVSTATASTATVALTASVTTKAAATITPGTSDQTIASGTYLTGTQTISGDADLTAANIKVGVGIFGVTGTYTSDATADASKILSGETAYVNGSKLTGSLVITTVYVGSAAPSASTGINGDIYIQS